MRHRYLEVTFRRGKPLAAYLYLPRASGAKAARTTDEGHGLRVDYDTDGAPMGIEITAPSAAEIEHVNAVLTKLGQPELAPEEWAPAKAA
jgi:uncharacterized protein YuzE